MASSKFGSSRPGGQNLVALKNVLPVGTWINPEKIQFSTPLALSVLNIQLVLQDGKVRFLSGTKTWKLDEHFDGGSWIYWYIVPKKNDDTILDIIASTNSPHIGPNGYKNYRYIWSTDINSKGQLTRVIQHKDFFHLPFYRVSILGTGEINRKDIHLYDTVPKTAGIINASLKTFDRNDAVQHIYLDGEEKPYISNCEGQFNVPVGNGKIQYESKGSIGEQYLIVYGWVDSFLL